jgi:two-component system response regulator FixJ
MYQPTPTRLVCARLRRQGRSMSEMLPRLLCAVVEDDPFMAELVRGFLSTAGFDVEFFPLGQSLLGCTHLLQFKVLLLDLSLPDIDGFELMEKLAARGVTMPVVLMSGHDLAVLNAAQMYGSGLGLNMRSTLTKPFTREELMAALGASA